jgi:D-alanine-D-alanine ligase
MAAGLRAATRCDARGQEGTGGTMPKYRIGVLYDVWWVDEPEETAPESKRRKKAPKKEKEVHQEVYEALKEGGHNPIYLTLEGDDESLLHLAETKTDLLYNLTESYAGDDTKDMNIAAYLELLGRRYTGAGPHGLHLAQDKALAKKIFAFHGIHTPYFATVYRGRVDWSHDIKFPVIVKPLREDGSIGIGFASVVESIKDLMERIEEIHAQFDTSALIEEYVEGREIYVGVLGNEKPEALPVIELDLSHVPEGTPKIAGTEVKWEKGNVVYEKAKPIFPDDLEEATTKRIQETAIEAFQALQLRDYGRIDMRLAADGTPYVLEVNPNCWLSKKAEFAVAAKKGGRSFEALINDIADLAMARYGVNGGG